MGGIKVDFYHEFKADNDKLALKYPLYDSPAVHPVILNIVSSIEVADHVKKAILAIDTSMRLADQVTDANKDTAVLTTDLLSAQFYQYMAVSYNSSQFKLLTDAVKLQNIEKSRIDDMTVERVYKIETAFVRPFIHHPDFNKLVEQSTYQKYIK